MIKPREKRKRAYIPFPERLAAALSMLLPEDQRNALRAARAPAKAVLKLFEFDHIALHALEGSDKWHNLDPKQVAAHREKSKIDGRIVDKVDRIIEKQRQHEENRRRLLRPAKRVPTTRWPKRKIRSRGFAR